MMLGPLLVLLASIFRKRDITVGRTPACSLNIVAWLIAGFFVLLTLRSLGLIPDRAVAISRLAPNWLTILAMAALGLSVDIRDVIATGGHVIVTVTVSLVLLALVSVCLAYGLVE